MKTQASSDEIQKTMINTHSCSSEMHFNSTINEWSIVYIYRKT